MGIIMVVIYVTLLLEIKNVQMVMPALTLIRKSNSSINLIPTKNYSVLIIQRQYHNVHMESIALLPIQNNKFKFNSFTIMLRIQIFISLNIKHNSALSI